MHIYFAMQFISASTVPMDKGAESNKEAKNDAFTFPEFIKKIDKSYSM